MEAAEREKLRNFLNERDRFCKLNGMRITVIPSDGTAEGELQLEESHLNGLDHVQGGVLLTLADFTFAAAVNSYGMQAVSLQSSASFIRAPQPGTVIRAKATPVSKTRRTAVIDVNVYDNQDRILLHTVITGFLLEHPLELP